ncbi:MAG TPA: carbon-nitrogen hydrolase family protein [Candidatus Dormibacteraeota bacterium]|nr:carbon-nitrogen hydrolase family protein [Candidatus Dormibacteraeota bacterium]
MPKQITVAALQLHAHDRSVFAERWPEMRNAVERALATKPDLLVLPEASLPAYLLGEEPVESGPIDAALGELAAIARAKSCAILVGAVQRIGERQFNAAVLLDRDGSIAGRAEKLFLWHFDRRWFVPGERIEPIPSTLGPIGALVCADGRVPTIAATLVERGACILTMPTAWVTSGRDSQNLENLQADLLAFVRAYENGVPFVAANKCGGEGGIVRYCGKSVIVSAGGESAARASQDREECIVATIDLSAPHRATHAVLLPPTVSSTTARTRRVAISAEPSGITPDMRRWLDAPDDLADAWRIDDATACDPSALADARLQGMHIFSWRSELEFQWCQRIARARAAELRIFGVVHHLPSGIVFAVDPEGAIQVASSAEQPIIVASFDLARTEQGELAPGSDALLALRRVAELRSSARS